MNNNNESLNKRFETWIDQANLENEEITKIKNNQMIQVYGSYKKGKILDKINLDDYISMLKFGLEKKIEINYLKQDKMILGLVCYDKYNGGRIGLVHGGCLFFTLYLCISILIDKELKLKIKCHDIYDKNSSFFHIFTTNYKNLVPIHCIHLIRVKFEDDEVIGEIINYQHKICVSIKAKYKNAKF